MPAPDIPPATGQLNGKAHHQPQPKSKSSQTPQTTGAQQAASSSDFEIPFPPLARASTLPTSLRPVAAAPSTFTSSAAAPAATPTAAAAPNAASSMMSNSSSAAVRRADPYHLAPEDAFYTTVLPPWDRNAAKLNTNGTSGNGNGNTSAVASGNDLPDARVARQTLRPGVANGSSSNIRRSASGALLATGGTDSRSRSRRRRRRTWKKLLWVKQSYPDNYTDQATFLENLQRNPRLKPYDFWPLVADSTVIVQHVCSVIVFVICFVGIFQDRVSPVAVVGWGTIMTCVGWLVWEWWAVQEQSLHGDSEDEDDHGVLRRYHREPSSTNDLSLPPIPQQSQQQRPIAKQGTASGTSTGRQSRLTVATTSTNSAPSDLLPSANSSTTSLLNMNAPSRSSRSGARVQPPSAHSRSSSIGNTNAPPPGGVGASAATSRNASTTNLWQPSLQSSLSHVSTATSINNATATGASAAPVAPSHRSSSSLSQQVPATPVTPGYPPPRRPPPALRGGRTPHRIATIKSAVLIYFTLLGLSPILKSLTRSTSSDSIWAMSLWLLAINIFFFDYSGVWVGAHKFPVASLSTNAALMASTVLASRLPSTGQVFSLTLFSIEVFGLFPVFRRYARHCSWRYHVGLTVLLVLGAGAGVGIIVTSPGDGYPWRSAIGGAVIAVLLAAVGMGGCSWWLIGLQKYKNEIYGPWDPARPVIISRRHWNDV
ncbi:phosphatidylinositol n-acetylglucosaminyltransferase subunit c [Ophiostoma piceae UAMH 11346]|uniref:Phosphatidylinositol n-acetylglucosaminyltransferase subunit c n=1 Tax=Ophiostoma piceae (strain UAMH 11346) TaxID=1262450 RepID=S3BWB1_OPHP1|nr:phosphatidylinositol n-acetylglucosaminyltransferase subunit c [Ophiostoma piceae UAMH 11346]